MRRQGFSFTQVCRLIRQEFLPLFRTESRPLLGYNDVVDYIQTIHPTPTAAIGTLVVMYPLDIFLAPPMNLAPLVRLVAEAPGLRFVFDLTCHIEDHGGYRHKDECKDLLEDFLHPQKNQQGLLRAARLFKSINIYGGSRLIVAVEVYAPYGKPWMPHRHMSVTNHFEREAVELLESVGLYAWEERAYAIHISSEDGCK
jgi:hypothetical protein